MKFFKNVFMNMVGQNLSLLLLLIANIAIARTLGPEGKGAFTLLVLFSGYIVLGINLGLGQAAIYYQGQKHYTVPVIAGNLFLISLLLGGVMAILLVATKSWYTETFLKEIPSSLVLLIILFTPVALSRLFVGHILAALQAFRWYVGLSLLESFLRLLLIVVLLAVGFGLAGTAYALISTLVIVTSIGWIVVWRKVGNIELKLNLSLLKRFTSYGVRTYSTVLMSQLNLRLDQFLVAFFLNIAQVGIYSVAVAIAEISTKFSNAITIVLFSRVAELDSESATKLTGRTIRFTMAFSLIIAVGLLLSGSMLIRLLFGEQFSSAITALYLLAPGVVMLNLSQILYTDLAGRGQPELGLYSTGLSLLFTLIGNFLFIPSMGINGAALTSSIAYGVSAIFILVLYQRTANQTLYQTLWLTMDDLALLRQIPHQLGISWSYSKSIG